MDYEELLQRIGSFGWYQKRLCVILFLTIAPNGFILVMFAYTQYPSEFYCRPYSLEGGEDGQDNSSEYRQNSNDSIVWTGNNNETLKRSECKMYSTNDSDVASENIGNTSRTIVRCTSGWIFKNNNTVITEFQLVCGDSWKPNLVVSLYMLGLLLAAFFGKLSDRFGRRRLFLVFTYLQFIFVGATGFSWNYESYATFVFLTGLSGLVNYVTGFVLATEMMGVKRKTEIALMYVMAYTFGYMMSPILGYAFPYWRHYLWACSVIGVLYIPLIWMLPESLRWLIVGGRSNEARALASNITKVNGRKLDLGEKFEKLTLLVPMEENIEANDEKIALEESTSKFEFGYFQAMKNRTVLVRSIVMYFTWFATSTAYFGISFNPSQLSGDRLISIFLSAVVEIPAQAFSYILVRWFGRPRTGFLFLSIAGITCAAAPFLKAAYPTLATVLVLIGKGTVTGSFFLAYIAISETTPTLIRNASMGVASASARFGGIVMPYLMLAGQGEDSQTEFVPLLVMGILAFVAGLLLLFFIPETKGVPVPDSCKQAVENKRIYGARICRKFEE